MGWPQKLDTLLYKCISEPDKITSNFFICCYTHAPLKGWPKNTGTNKEIRKKEKNTINFTKIRILNERWGDITLGINARLCDEIEQTH